MLNQEAPICGDTRDYVTHTKSGCPCVLSSGHMTTAPEVGHECVCGAAWGWRSPDHGLRTQTVAPRVWTRVDGTGIDVQHINSENVDLCVSTDGVVFLSGRGYWQVRRTPAT